MSLDQGQGTPEQRMAGLLGGFRSTQMLHVAAKLGIADELADGPKSVGRLAQITHSNEGALFRLLRALAGMGVFAERSDGSFELTPLASTLRKDTEDSQRMYALSYGESWWWNAFGQLLHSVQTGEPGFDHVYGMNLFEYLNGHPDAARVFNGNMTAMTVVGADAVAAAYDFSAAGALIDIGGGHGALASAILHKNPHLRAVLFDQPLVIDNAPQVLQRLGIQARCELVPGDFFVSVPSGGDIYTLKDILHDWDDTRSMLILGNIRRVMGARARLLIIERVIPSGNGPFVGKHVDITMLVLTGGMERTELEYRRLIEAAGLKLSRVVPTATGSSIIETVPV